MGKLYKKWLLMKDIAFWLNKMFLCVPEKLVQDRLGKLIISPVNTLFQNFAIFYLQWSALLF